VETGWGSRQRFHPVRDRRAGGTRSKFGKQTTDAGHDENSVVFTKAQMPVFEQLRAAVEAALGVQHAPRESAGSVLVADELAKLGDLLRQGLLTPDEFQQQKARLLGGGG